jgi:hypothetical protein
MQEADLVRKTEYWQALLNLIEEKRVLLMNKLVHDPLDTLPELRGQIKAIEWVLEQPEKIIENLRAKG